MPRRVYPDLFAFFQHSGETQTQVADDLGISYATMSMIKWGERQPNLPLALRLSERCGVPLESLIRSADREKAS